MLDARMAVFAITLAVTVAGCSRADAPPMPVNPVATDSPSAATSAVMPYVLENTEVRELVADGLGRTYPVLVSLPESYGSNPTRRYPLVIVADAPYAFPLVRSMAARMGNHGEGLEEFVLVGLGYAKGDTPAFSRRRDYTPSTPANSDVTSEMPGRAPAFGQADAYTKFLADQVLPMIAAQYRVDMHRKVLAGHSYGGLLGTHILLTEPTMFEYYILSSPSLWFDGKIMLNREAAYARGHKDMVANVFLSAGAFETVVPGSSDPRYNRTDDLVRDMQLLQSRLEARRYPGLRIQSQVLADEDHLSVNPSAFSRGLLWALSR